MIKFPVPSDRRAYIWIPLAIFLLAFLGRTLYFYRGIYVAPNIPTSQPASVTILSEPQQVAPQVGDGNQVVLIDNSHLNKFTDEEMTTLFGRITAAGGRVEVILPLHDAELESRLRGASAFVILANQEFYELDELIILEDFVRDGGRLLIVGDPTRVTFVNAINSVAGHFGIIYEDDYIYNLEENDGNYLNVILRDFAESPLTEGVEEIVVRAAHSMRAAEGGLVFGDENTYSSRRETPGGVTAAVLTENGNVLALPDLTFLTGPYNTFADNDQFIDNVATFLLGGQRNYDLLDFPHFIEGRVELVFPDSDLLTEAFSVSADLRSTLIDAGALPVQEDNVLPGDQAIVVSTYSGVPSNLQTILQQEGVRILNSSDQISLRDVGQLDQQDSVLLQLHQLEGEEGGYVLFILADDAESLERGVSLLLSGEIEGCMLRPGTAFCAPSILATPTPTLAPTRTPFPSPTPFQAFESSPVPPSGN
jgi:hypothetical protein